MEVDIKLLAMTVDPATPPLTCWVALIIIAVVLISGFFRKGWFEGEGLTEIEASQVVSEIAESITKCNRATKPSDSVVISIVTINWTNTDKLV